MAPSLRRAKGKPKGGPSSDVKGSAFSHTCECNCHEQLRGLECPFTWHAAPLMVHMCSYFRDKLFNAGTPFTAILERLNVIYGFICGDRHKDARALLVECYLQLLPGPHFDPGCALIQDYRPALRHVLDSMWAGLCMASRKQACGSSDDSALKAFIKTITPLARLDKRQQACLLVIRARFFEEDMKEDLRLLRQAIAMSPKEGEWRCILGFTLQEGRGDMFGPKPSQEEIGMLRDAYRLRKNVNSLTRLARTLSDCGPEGKLEAQQLLDEASRLWPKNPAVPFRTHQILPHLLNVDMDTLLSRLQELLERTMELAGSCAHLHMKLGFMHMQRWRGSGVGPLAEMQFALALSIDRGASEAFKTVYASRVGHIQKNAKTANENSVLPLPSMIQVVKK